MPAIVECDNAASRTREGCDPASLDPIHLFVGSKTVNEHDRDTRSFVEKGNLDRAIAEDWHSRFLAVRQRYRNWLQMLIVSLASAVAKKPQCGPLSCGFQC